MTNERDELRDDRLADSLRAALASHKPPASWVQEALSLPARLAEARGSLRAGVTRGAVPARERWLVALLPHLCGIALLVGLAVTFFLRRDLLLSSWGIWEEIATNFRGLLPQAGSAASLSHRLAADLGLSPQMLAALVFGPAFFLLLAEASRGFPTLRRWLS